jgi:hypothetical protein
VGSDLKKEGTSEFLRRDTARAKKSACDGLTVVREHLGQITAPSLLITSRIDHTVNWERGEDIVAIVLGPGRADLAGGLVSRGDAG